MPNHPFDIECPATVRKHINGIQYLFKFSNGITASVIPDYVINGAVEDWSLFEIWGWITDTAHLCFDKPRRQLTLEEANTILKDIAHE